MEVYITLAVLLGATAVVAIANSVNESRRARRDWILQADRIGLSPAGPGEASANHVTGVVDQLLVTMLQGGIQENRNWTVRILDERGDIPVDLELARTSPLDKLAHRTDLVTGDEDFDFAFRVGGPPESIAALPRDTRKRLLTLMSSGDLSLSHGELQWTTHQTGFNSVRLATAAEQLIRIAQMLRCPENEMLTRLAYMGEHDSRDVRRRSLELLFSVGAGTPEARIVAERSLQTSTYPELRLLAGRTIGDAAALEIGQHILIHSVLREDLPKEYIRWALCNVDPPADTRVLERILARADSPRALVDLALEEVGRQRLSEFVPRLLEMIDGTDTELLITLARVLGEIGDSRAEATLLACLSTSEDHALVEVIQALGSVGSAAAVEPLLPLARGVLTPTSIKSAAAQALSAIRSRLGGPDEGALSLAPGEGGELSLPEKLEGRLSYPRDQEIDR